MSFCHNHDGNYYYHLATTIIKGQNRGKYKQVDTSKQVKSTYQQL